MPGPHPSGRPIIEVMTALQDFSNLIGRWAAVWDVPDLAETIQVRYSPRMKRALARCTPETGSVRLAGYLADATPELVEEVLCHEAAHVAAHRLTQGTAKPHGPEWRDLVRLAGFEPRTTAPANKAPESGLATQSLIGRAQTPKAHPRYQHRCPVCQATRTARRPVPSWHCAECMDAGLEGAMVITRLDSPRHQD